MMTMMVMMIRLSWSAMVWYIPSRFQTDPRLNRALAKVIEEAQSQDIRKATIEAAIKRGGNKDGSIDKEILVEIRGPGQCAILAETLVPNRGFLDSKINTVSFCITVVTILVPLVHYYPTNIGIVRCTVSVATIVVVSAGVEIWLL